MPGLKILEPEVATIRRVPARKIFLISAAAFVLWALIAGGVFLVTALRGGLFFEVKSVEGKVLVMPQGRERGSPAEPGRVLRPGERLWSDKASGAVLHIPGLLQARVKENSEISAVSPGFLKKRRDVRLELKEGTLLAATGKDFKGNTFEVSAPQAIMAVRGTGFRVEATGGPEGETWLGVLRGEVAMKDKRSGRERSVRAMEQSRATPLRGVAEPQRVSYEQWRRLVEVYDLYEENPLDQRRQEDLSRRAGNLFLKASDHATFYSPGWGFCEREFVEEPGGRVILVLDYDVTPPGSFAGLYIKTRDLNLASAGTLSMRVKGDGEAGFPRGFRVEFKSKGVKVASEIVWGVTTDWKEFRFPLKSSESVPISEITLVFLHDPSGRGLSGRVFISDLSLS